MIPPGGAFFHGRAGVPGGPGIAVWSLLEPGRPETANRAFSRAALVLLDRPAGVALRRGGERAGVAPWRWLDLLGAEDVDLEVRLALVAGLLGADVGRLAPRGSGEQAGGGRRAVPEPEERLGVGARAEVRALYELVEGLVDAFQQVRRALRSRVIRGGPEVEEVVTGLERLIRGLPGAAERLARRGCVVWPVPPLERDRGEAGIRIALPSPVIWSAAAARAFEMGGISGLPGAFWRLEWSPGELRGVGRGPLARGGGASVTEGQARLFLAELAKIRSLGPQAVRLLNDLSHGAGLEIRAVGGADGAH